MEEYRGFMFVARLFEYNKLRFYDQHTSIMLADEVFYVFAVANGGGDGVLLVI